jgi:hypothetical protein
MYKIITYIFMFHVCVGIISNHAFAEPRLYEIYNYLYNTNYPNNNALYADHWVDYDDLWKEKDGVVDLKVKYSAAIQTLGYYTYDGGNIIRNKLLTALDSGYNPSTVWEIDGDNNGMVKFDPDGEFGFFDDVSFVPHPPYPTRYSWYSEETLNSDNRRHLITLTAPVDRYILAWEDLPNLGDADYNDIVVEVASASPVPEPCTMLLMGAGLTGLAGLVKRRRRQQ